MNFSTKKKINCGWTLTKFLSSFTLANYFIKIGLLCSYGYHKTQTWVQVESKLSQYLGNNFTLFICKNVEKNDFLGRKIENLLKYLWIFEFATWKFENRESKFLFMCNLQTKYFTRIRVLMMKLLSFSTVRYRFFPNI